MQIRKQTLYTKFVIFYKLQKSSYEFAQIREGYVTNDQYCITVFSDFEFAFQKILKSLKGLHKESIKQKVLRTKNISAEKE